MTSPSSNFVFVDKSCSVNATPVLKTAAPNTTYIPQQQTAIRNRSAIVSEDFVCSGDSVLATSNVAIATAAAAATATATVGTSVNYVKASDLLNSAQVIQFVSDEQAALIQQYQPTILERSPEKIVRPSISTAQVSTRVSGTSI